MTVRCLLSALACASLGAAACGGGGSGPPTGPTPPPVDNSVTQTFSGTVPAYGIASHAWTPSKAGSVTATLTWTLGADLDIYVTAASCTGYPPDNCVILARAASASTTTLREELTLTVTASTPLLLWVDSFHPQTPVAYSLTTVLR